MSFSLSLLITSWLTLCAWQDVRTRTVSNWLTLPALMMAILLRLTDFAPGSAWLATITVVGLLLLAWQHAQIGGADVKALTAMALIDVSLVAAALLGVGLWYGGAWLQQRKAPASVPAFAGMAVGLALMAAGRSCAFFLKEVVPF